MPKSRNVFPKTIAAVINGVPFIPKDTELKKILMVTGIIKTLLSTANRFKKINKPTAIW